MSTIRTLADLTTAILARARAVVRVAVTGTLSDFDAGASTVTASPDVSDGVPPPAIPGVPVLMPGGSLRGLTFGLAPGDRGVLLVRHRSHDEVDSGTAALPVTPRASRQMSLADAVCLPGYVPPADGRPAAHYRSDGEPVLYMDTGEALHVGLSTAALALARADLVLAELQAIKATFDAHTHLSAAPGSPTAVPVPLLGAPGSVACDRVKVDS
jgi:hypothetical protein